MVNGLVLAGGKSSRMGRDKAGLKLNNRTLLEHCCQLLQQSGCQQVLVSRNQNGFLQDRFAGAGPLGGIDAAVNQLPTEQLLLIVPVDMPQLSPELLQQLANYSLQNQRSCYFQLSFLPACLLITSELKDYLYQQLSREGQGSVKALLKNQDAHALPCPEDKKLLNINTPSQFQTLCETCSTTELLQRRASNMIANCAQENL